MIKVDISHLKRNNLKKKGTSSTPSLVKTKETEKVISNNLLPNENSASNDNLLLPSQIKVELELSENKELNDYLITKSQELLGVQINARLNLGRIFQEVFDKLAGSPQDGVYVKWLEVNGFNKMTALRHRNRFKLYKLMPTDHLKYLISTASQKIVDAFLNDDEKLNILISIDFKINKNELEALAFPVILTPPTINKNVQIQFEIKEKYNIFKEKINNLDLSKLDEKQIVKFSKLLEGFEKLLKDIKE